MTLVMTRPDRIALGRPAQQKLLRRLRAAPRLWARRLARRRLLKSILAETDDPGILADLGINLPRPSHVERWIMAMLYHQR
jgi:hypothetical protein